MAAVTSPNFGLILNKPPINIPPQGLRDGRNFRCRNGTLESKNLGWDKLTTNWTLGGKAILIDNFFPRSTTEKLIFGTPTDLFVYNPGLDAVVYITPAYVVGTASVTGVTVTGVGTSWLTNAKAGDKIYFGANNQNLPAATWRTILTVNSDTSLTLTAAPGNSAAAPYTLRRVFSSGVNNAFWDTDVFLNDGDTGQDLWMATNGFQPVVSWNGMDTFAKLRSEQLFVCQSLRTYSNMVIYGNVLQTGSNLTSTIINSDIGLPMRAGATGTGVSEQFIVHAHSDPILTMLPLGDYLIIYCERTIVISQFVGDPIVFTFRTVSKDYGPVGRKAINNFGDYHEFVGADAAYTFDGATLKESNSHVWREILRQADPIRRDAIYSHMDEQMGDLIWSVPSTSDAGAGTPGNSPVTAWVEHYLEVPAVSYGQTMAGSPYSKRDFPFVSTGYYQRTLGLTWTQASLKWQEYNFAWNDQFFQAAFPINLAGDANGQIWTLNQTQTGGGVALPSYVRTGRKALRSGRERDMVSRIYPFARQTPYNLEVTLFLSDFVSGEPTSKGIQKFDQNLIQGKHFVSFFRRGRAMEFMFGSSLGQPWTLEGWDYDTVNGGLR